MKKLSHTEAPEKSMSGRDLIKAAYAAGYGISAGEENVFELETEIYPGEDFFRGSILPPASQSTAPPLTDAEIDFLLS